MTIESSDTQAAQRLTAGYQSIRTELNKQIVGMDRVIEELLISVFSRGHCLLVGVPGLAKTLLISSLAKTLSLSFARIQFTPDLMPADVTGHTLYDPKNQVFTTRRGPVFVNLLLADEINRAPAKVQSALLEVMQEHQVTIAGETHRVPEPFLVMATQNPIEYEGTYPLPEAELDRFTMRIAIGYPPLADEARMLSENAAETPLDTLEPVASAQEVLGAIQDAHGIYVEDSLNRYVVAVLRHTRSDSRLYLGASPRAGLALLRVAKARALVAGREFVDPDDVKSVAPTVLAHRLILAPEARSSGLDAEELVRDVIERTPVPV